MTETSQPEPRPVSLIAVAAIFVLLSLFGYAAIKLYARDRGALTQNEAPENLSKELAWRATPELRRQALADLKAAKAQDAASYGWIDKASGKVRLPIDRAMQLVAEEHAK